MDRFLICRNLICRNLRVLVIRRKQNRIPLIPAGKRMIRRPALPAQNPLQGVQFVPDVLLFLFLDLLGT